MKNGAVTRFGTSFRLFSIPTVKEIEIAMTSEVYLGRLI